MSKDGSTIAALTAAGIHLASPKFRTQDILKLVDWSILVLFMGLFVVTGAFQATGYGDHVVQWLAHAGLNLQSPSILALVTAALSNLINNAAAVLLLVKVVDVANPTTAYVLALANSFGGSLLIIGSVSNIIVVQFLFSLLWLLITLFAFISGSAVPHAYWYWFLFFIAFWIVGLASLDSLAQKETMASNRGCPVALVARGIYVHRVGTLGVNL
jgi:di/tricarboxylate transporter